MLLPDGSAKGLRTILKECGINTTLKEDDTRTIISHHDDFITEKTQVEHYVIGREKGFQCLFLLKFYMYFELNPIERVRWQSKWYCRTHTNFTLAKLRDILNPAEHTELMYIHSTYIMHANTKMLHNRQQTNAS